MHFSMPLATPPLGSSAGPMLWYAQCPALVPAVHSCMLSMLMRDFDMSAHCCAVCMRYPLACSCTAALGVQRMDDLAEAALVPVMHHD